MIVRMWNFFYSLYQSACRRFNWLHNFVLYAVIGVLAACLDYSIFWSVWHFTGLSPEISSLIGNLCGFLFTFTGNTFYNFKKSTHVVFRFVSYFLITIGGMTLSTLLIHYAKTLMNVHLLKAVLVLFVIPAIQFILNKTITYRDFSEGDTALIITPGKWWKEKTFMQKFFVIFLLASGLMWVVVPSTYHSVLHFDPAETLMWGSTFNWGSAKHPPMSGIMLYNFCRIFGFPNFAIFLCSQLCVTIGFVYIYKLARCFFKQNESVIATLLITFYFFYNFETPKFNANIPHLLFMPMMCYYFYRGCTANKWHHWLLMAAASAGACLSKYSAGVLAISFILFLVVNKEARRVLLSIKPYVAGIFFCALLTPHILHLINTDFLVLHYINHGKAVKYGYFMQIAVLAAAIIVPLLCMSAVAFITLWLGNKKFPGWKLSIHQNKAMQYTLCIIGGQAAFLLGMGFIGHRLLTIWTFPLFLTAGIFIMSFVKSPVSERTQKCFAALCTLFAAVMLLIPLIHYNTSSKYRYHLDKAEFRAAAEKFYHEQTGKAIPFVIGDIWETAMLQNSLRYQVKASPCSDPILTGMHREFIARNGAIAITRGPESASQKIRQFFDVELKWHKIDLEYCARFGKKKTFTFFLAAVPPTIAEQDVTK